MAVSNHSYIIIGDNSDTGNFTVEYDGLDVIVRNILDGRYSLTLNKDDWKELKKFIDEQFSGK